MTTKIPPREGELLSAYLDGQLAPNERARLEARLRKDVQLRAALVELRRTRAVLRSQPRLRAPRNFTLTPQMVGKSVSGRPVGFARYASPALGIASALAGLLFVLVLIGDFLTVPRSSPTLQSQQKPVARQAASNSANVTAVAPQELPKSAPLPGPTIPTIASAESLPLGAGAGTLAESTSTETIAPTMMAAAPVQKPDQVLQTETAEANTPTSVLPPFTLGKSILVSPTETETPTLMPTLEPTQTPTLTLTLEPTQTPTHTPTLEPTQTPTLEPTLEPTPYPPPQPAVSAIQAQPYPSAHAPAYPVQGQLPRATDRTILRVVEVSFAALALAAGLAAIYLRRIGRG